MKRNTAFTAVLLAALLCTGCAGQNSSSSAGDPPVTDAPAAGTEATEAESPETDAPDATELKDVKGESEFRNVTYSYDGTKEVLHDINCDFLPGKSYAIVGGSGSGKS